MMLLQPRTQEALRASPSAGWVGRRDRAVLVLSQMAGMSDEDIAGLTAGDVVIADGAATITAPTGTITLPASDDSMTCGPCALSALAAPAGHDRHLPGPLRHRRRDRPGRPAVRRLTAPVPRHPRGHRHDPALAPAAADRPLGTDLGDPRPARASRPSPTVHPRPRRQGPRPPTTKQPRPARPLSDTRPGIRHRHRAAPDPQPTRMIR